jgi:hypothetical protein
MVLLGRKKGIEMRICKPNFVFCSGRRKKIKFKGVLSRSRRMMVPVNMSVKKESAEKNYISKTCTGCLFQCNWRAPSVEANFSSFAGHFKRWLVHTPTGVSFFETPNFISVFFFFFFP